jgi:hypothetical protein
MKKNPKPGYTTRKQKRKVYPGNEEKPKTRVHHQKTRKKSVPWK